eukprot:s3507_g12.t1
MRINAHLPGIFVEHIEAVANFSSWLAPLATHVSGIFQTKFATGKNLEACHCLKLIRRELLPKELADVLEMPRCLKNVAADPRDVILLPKLYIGCAKLSQKPIVFIPRQHVAALAERPPSQVIPRAQFSARRSNEFLKTAESQVQVLNQKLQQPSDPAHAPAAAPGKGRGRGRGKGRGRGDAGAAASSKPAAVKAKAKTKAKSVPAPGPDASEGSASKRRRISIPSDAEVGCGKCYHNKEVGCTTCRPKAGLVESSEKGKWVWKTD